MKDRNQGDIFGKVMDSVAIKAKSGTEGVKVTVECGGILVQCTSYTSSASYIGQIPIGSDVYVVGSFNTGHALGILTISGLNRDSLSKNGVLQTATISIVGSLVGEPHIFPDNIEQFGITSETGNGYKTSFIVWFQNPPTKSLAGLKHGDKVMVQGGLVKDGDKFGIEAIRVVHIKETDTLNTSIRRSAPKE